jgi:hypothetical protein
VCVCVCVCVCMFSMSLSHPTKPRCLSFFTVFSLFFNSRILHSASDIGYVHNKILFTATATPLTWHAPFKYVVSPRVLGTWSLDTNKSGYEGSMKVRYTKLQFFLFYIWVYTTNGPPHINSRARQCQRCSTARCWKNIWSLESLSKRSKLKTVQL